MIKLIITTVLFFSYGIWAQTIVFKDPNSCGVPKADFMVQAVTQPYNGYVEGMFWHEESKCLLWVERYNATLFFWNYTSGAVHQLTIEELEDEEFVGLFPKTTGVREYVLVSGMYLRTIQLGQKNGVFGYNLTLKPFATIHDVKGYKINKAHSDLNGRLFLTTRFQNERNNHSDKLYKIEGNNDPELVFATFWAGDFGWSPNYSTFQMISEVGTVVYQSNYSLATGALSGNRPVSGLGPFALIERFACLEMDDTNNLWIGIDGKVVRFAIDDADRHRVKFNAPCITSCTFGGSENRDLFVGTCNRNPVLSNTEGSVYVVSGMRSGGVADNAVAIS